jgi:putative oxidoreductase
MSTSLIARIDSLSDRVRWLPGLLLRLVLGVTFVKTGWGKLHHLDNVEQYFRSLHIPAPGIQAPMIATIEFVGGLLLIAGLATRIVAALLVGVMAVAIYTAIWPDADGVTAVLGGIEAIYLAAFVHLAVNGGGAASLDRLLGRYLPALAPTSITK